MDISDNESSIESSSTPTPTPSLITITILSSEIKDLRNKIMSVKKSVTKGDKKQKKAIQDELNVLESLLTAKQEELQKLKEAAAAANNTNDNSAENEVENLTNTSTNTISKARLKKERRKEEKAAEWEANRQAALHEIASRPDLALQESKSFDHRLSEKGFRIVEVAADGHCLFSAIGCQLDPPKDHWQLRALAAKYLLEHREEYENFIELDSIELNSSEPNATDKYREYCRKLESTGMWGGQIELEVLSRSLNICVTVLQAEGPELVFNEDAEQKIYLSYHRFAFSLGEHYNALIRTI